MMYGVSEFSTDFEHYIGYVSITNSIPELEKSEWHRVRDKKFLFQITKCRYITPTD